MRTLIDKIKEEFQNEINNLKKEIELFKKDKPNIVYGTILKYVIQEGFHGVLVSPDDIPSYIAQGETVTFASSPTQPMKGAIVPLDESPVEISRKYGNPVNLIGLRVRITIYGQDLNSATAKIVNDFGNEDPKFFTKPDKKCTIRTAVSAKL